MKRLLLIAGAALGSLALSVVSVRAQSSAGGVLREARVTQVVKDVKILASQAEARPATLSDTVRGDTAVRTGVESRAELTFGDLTIARLGANTIFSFNQSSRTVELGNGAILLRVPKGSGGTKIQTAAVTAAITGTTVIVEYHPKSYAKYLVLEGTMRIYLKGVLGESVLLGPGQMMILNPNAKRLSEPVDFDLKRLLATSLFIQGFRPLPSVPLLADVQHTQLEKKAAGELIDTNLVIFGRGTLVTLTDPQSLDVIDRKTAAVTPPAIPPIKFGRPPVIANSVGYQITGTTAIQTDPTITTPARTDFGKFYRGPGPDANFSTWSFDSTRPFDTSSGFDAFYSGAGVPIAAFKFQSLVLAGNPTISTANGGATFLELIGVDGITSGTPGGTLTFAGIDNLLLATQNGSILLGREISFQNIPTLFLYARGAGSNIVLGSPITGTRDLFLEAEGSVQVNGAANVTNFRSVTGGDFLAGTGPVNATTIDIRSGGNLNFTLSQFAVGGTLDGTVTLNAGGAANIDTRGDQTVLNNASSVLVNAQTINFLGDNPTTIDFGRARTANFTAGTGGFQASTVAFNGASLLNVTSGADINVFRIVSALKIAAATSISAVGDLTAIAAISAGTTINVGGILGTNFSTITAGQSITSGGDLRGTDVQAGTFINVGGNASTGSVNAGTDIRVTGNFQSFAGAIAGGSITVGGNVGTPASITAGTTINVGGNFSALNTTAGQSITVGGNLTLTNSATAGTTINVGGTFRAPTATAGGDISANRITLFNVTTPGVLRAGAGGITPFIATPPANLVHSFTVDSIVAAGGIDFSGDNFVAAGDGKDGGKLSIFAKNTITFDAANIASANFDGASGVPTNSAGGSGGQLMITTLGAITANVPIEATTGLNATGVPFGGAGGTVSLTSAGGPVNVNSSILVSSNDPGGPAPSPLRRSATGGTLSLSSGLRFLNAITLGGGAQLLSLLNAGAPGPAGQITISSAGGNIVDNGALLEADRGTITIQHTAAATAGIGQITLNGGTITSETLLASSRGDLTVGTTTAVNLRVVTLSLLATGNIAWNGGTQTATAIASSGNVLVQAGNDISITGGTDIERTNGGITDGINLTINAGRNLQTNAGLTLVTDGSGLTTGGNINLVSGAAMTLNGGVIVNTGPVTADQNSGSNFSLTAGGPITVVDLIGTVQTGAGRTLTTGGNINVGGTSYTATLGDGGLDLTVNNSAPGIIGTGGNITLNITGNLATGPAGQLRLAINNSNRGRIQTGANIVSTIGGTLTADSVSVEIDNRVGGFIGTGATIDFKVNGTLTTKSDASFTILNSQRGTPGGTIVSDASIKLTLANTNIGGAFNVYIDNADGSIGGTGGVVTIQINGTLAVAGRIDVNGALTATGNVTAGTLSATNVTAPDISVGAGGITPFTFPNEIFQQFQQHTITITTGALISTGGINFNAPDVGPAGGPFQSPSLTLNVPTLTIGPNPADNIQGPVTFNGSGVSNFSVPAGDGGTFTVNAAGLINVNNPIQATTGLRPADPPPTGIGGNVTLNSTNGGVTIASRIVVSSNDPSGGGAPQRKSNQGGTINVRSDAPTGTAINVTSTGQLLSLLDAAAAGPGGKITFVATGANSRVTITGGTAVGGGAPPDSIRADRGTVDIRHTGAQGTITLTNSNIAADIVKVGAFGNNGVLTIGGGRINADTLLQLYATGSSGSVVFVSDVFLSGNGMKIIAGNSVTLLNNVVVTVGPSGAAARAADVYVPNLAGANYSNFNGGNNSTSGKFIIEGTAGSPVSGANTILGVAPPAFAPSSGSFGGH